MDDLDIFSSVLVWAVPILFAITVHEVAHGWVASRLGDQTARRMGRLTLNPVKHIDPIGTIVLPALLFYLGGFIFGWAKPVPVNWQKLGHPRRDMALVAAAGPGANLLMMILWALLAKLILMLQLPPGWLRDVTAIMCMLGIRFNIILMVLNLLPLLPLDGGRILTSLLPPDLAAMYSRLERYGLLILIALIATGLLGKVLWPSIKALEQVIYNFL